MATDSDKPIDTADPFARRLLSQYVRRRTDDLAAMRAALDEGRFEDIRLAGHNMSGTGAAYGLEKVSELGAGLEFAAEAKHAGQIEKLIAELESYIGNLRLT